MFVRLLVTGASGFLGSEVVRRLSSNNRDDPETLLWQQPVHGSLLSSASRKLFLDLYEPDAVLHLAWQSTSSPDYEMNTGHYDWSQATLEFATECSHRGIWFICAGSAIDEYKGEASHLDSSSYLESKRLLKSQVQRLIHFQSTMTWLRIQYVFSLSALRPRLLRAVLESPSPHDFRPTNPESLHDFIHIDDVATAMLSIITSGVKGEITIGTGFLISTADFVEAVKFQCGYLKEKPNLSVVRSDLTSTHLQKIKWSPTVSCQFLGVEVSEV